MSNTALWDFLGKTDPAQTKDFTRGGGFKGTAIKPIYTERKMTERFGPCGVGWGIGEPSFQVVPAGEEVLVYCTVSVWFVQDGKVSAPVYGVGGDMAVKKYSAKTSTNDEAFKSAFTDAVGNAFKHIGMSADVHMGRFEDSKYVAAVKKEIEEKDLEPDDRSPQQICDDFLDLVRDITDRDEYVDTWNANKTSLKRIQRAVPPVYNQFIKDLSAIIGPKGFNESKEESGAVSGETPPPATDPKGTDKGSNGDSPSRDAARKLYAAWKESPHLTALETSMKQAGFLTTGEDGWVVKPDSNLGVIRENDIAAFRDLESNADKLRIQFSKGKAA